MPCLNVFHNEVDCRVAKLPAGRWCSACREELTVRCVGRVGTAGEQCATRLLEPEWFLESELWREPLCAAHAVRLEAAGLRVIHDKPESL